jgi:trk system potassium uptake protein TrkA
MAGNYLVLGLGRFGAHIARELYQQGAHVLAIDKNPDAVDDIMDEVTRAVTCDADDAEVLQAIGAFDVDVAIVAIARAFDVTVLVTHSLIQHAIKRIVVRVESERQSQAIRALGATDIVFPERDIAESVARRLIYPDLAEEIPLGADFAVMEVPCPPEFAGKTLQELNLRRRYKVNLIAVKRQPEDRDREVVTPAPAPEDPLPAGSKLLLLGTLKKLDWLRKKLKLPLHVREHEEPDEESEEGIRD